jgi:SAM-dependent methyltransferase
MQSQRQLPAKVFKRFGQLRRLGVRGLIRTAYIRALGPTAYALSDRARKVAAIGHRRRALSAALPARKQRLETRTRALLRDGRPGERIAFGSAFGQFLKTLEVTLDLQDAGCAVPRLIDVDWSDNSLTREVVRGSSWSDYIRGGGSADQCRTRLEQALSKIHRSGYVLNAMNHDSVIVASDDRPFIADLGSALPLAGLSRDMSVFLRDKDRLKCNELFGTRLVTAPYLRELLSPTARISRDKVRGFTEVYAPVVIRDDIRWGKIWNTDLGIGRWNFIMKQHLPIPLGGSVLDLGSNNGFNPLQMLRGGAASAVGVEIESQAIKQGELLKSAYEWLDNREYDFRYIHGSQADLANYDLPRFDVVTAFCSLYYLPEEQIRDLVRYIRSLTGLLVLQCNTDRLIDRSGEEETYRKASLGFAVEMLEQAGFTDRRIVAPAGYSRPLVIGRAPGD